MFYIKQKNWDTILGYAEEAHTEHQAEIGGMSVMVEDKDGDWHLENPVILKQVITAGNTILDKDELAIYYTKEAKRLGKKNFRFCWWHSHHTMNAFWSGTDLTAIDEFNEGDFSFALVVNLKEEYKFRVSVWKPVEVHEDVELTIVNPRARVSKRIKENVAAMCTKPVYKVPAYTGYSWRKENGTHTDLLKEAAEDPRQERLPFHTTAGQTGLSGKPKTYFEILEEVDEVISEVVAGSMTYAVYKMLIDDLNKELLDDKSIYEITLVAENALESLLHVMPSDLVVNKQTGEILDQTGVGWGYGV